MKIVKAKDTTKKCVEILRESIKNGRNVIYVVDVRGREETDKYAKRVIIPALKDELMDKRQKVSRLRFKSGSHVAVVSQWDEDRKLHLARSWSVLTIISDNAPHIDPMDIREAAFHDSNYVLVAKE